MKFNKANNSSSFARTFKRHPVRGWQKLESQCKTLRIHGKNSASDGTIAGFACTIVHPIQSSGRIDHNKSKKNGSHSFANTSHFAIVPSKSLIHFVHKPPSRSKHLSDTSTVQHCHSSPRPVPSTCILAKRSTPAQWLTVAWLGHVAIVCQGI